MDETKDKAYLDYQEGMKYKDIADKYGVSLNTVKSWKKRYGWVREKGAHKTKRVHTKSIRKKARAPDEKEVDEPVLESDELTDKQRFFCMYYVKYFNATKAYQKAYGCAYFTAKTNGNRMLTNANIKNEIERLKTEQQQSLFFEGKDVLQKYIDIAFADITDFIEFGQKETPEVNAITGEPLIDEDGEQVMYSYSFVDFKNADEVDGTIITEVKKGKDGVSVKLADKMKALDFLSKYTDLLSDDNLKRLKEEKMKADIAKARSETKGTGNANISVVDFSNLSTEELRAIANSNKRTD